MRVIPIGSTEFNPFNVKESGYKPHYLEQAEFPSSSDELAEMAGRNCYQSWHRPNPSTATNKGYLKNILDQGHFSVLEHASITFYVDGISRSLLTELERHRFLSFSVVSQRYVKQEFGSWVTPPAIRENDNAVKDPEFREYDGEGYPLDDQPELGELFDQAMGQAYVLYEDIADILVIRGLPKKQALEAARSVLPNATEVKMVVTGNVRAWRDVIGKRYHEAADAEIREFATEVLRHLRTYAPNSVQDIPEVPYV